MAFITKKHIPRRTFLRNTGVTLALPLLDAMMPAGSLAQTAAQPKQRFVGMFFPHGMAPGHWEPKMEGALPDKLPYILESLEPVKNQSVVLSGLFELRKVGENGSPSAAATVIATLVAFVTGYAAIAWLIRYLGTHTLRVFVVYRILGVLVLALTATGAIS